MYTVDVDLVLRFVPPMEDRGDGIRLTRTIELPFPPAPDIAVFSKEWEDFEDPMGYFLREVTWDLDRKRFLAETEVSVTGTPIALIPLGIRRLTDHGWTFDSYRSHYRAKPRRRRKPRTVSTIQIWDWAEDEAEAWDAEPKGRPNGFKLILHATAATMAELHNNSGIAYAMLSTGGFVDVREGKPFSQLSPAEKRFTEAIQKYNSMTSDQQWGWAERVRRRYPSLMEIVEAIP